LVRDFEILVHHLHIHTRGIRLRLRPISRRQSWSMVMEVPQKKFETSVHESDKMSDKHTPMKHARPAAPFAARPRVALLLDTPKDCHGTCPARPHIEQHKPMVVNSTRCTKYSLSSGPPTRRRGGQPAAASDSLVGGVRGGVHARGHNQQGQLVCWLRPLESSRRLRMVRRHAAVDGQELVSRLQPSS